MRERIADYIRSGHAGLYLISPEEARVEADLKALPNPANAGKSKFDLQVHEFRLGIQIELYSFRGVWR